MIVDCFCQVTCYPDLQIWQRTPQDEILILGCDGVWDVLASYECVELARDIILSGETSSELIAEELVDIALNKGLVPLLVSLSNHSQHSHSLTGSRDNISAAVVRLPGAPAPTSSGGVMARRAAREQNAPRNP